MNEAISSSYRLKLSDNDISRYRLNRSGRSYEPNGSYAASNSGPSHVPHGGTLATMIHRFRDQGTSRGAVIFFLFLALALCPAQLSFSQSQGAPATAQNSNQTARPNQSGSQASERTVTLNDFLQYQQFMKDQTHEYQQFLKEQTHDLVDFAHTKLIH